MAHLIECWFDDFSNAKKQIDDYSGSLVSGMKECNTQIEMLQSGIWIGDDASKFLEEWSQATSGDEAIQTKFEHALDSLSRYLEDVERMYRTAQQKAFDSAYRNCQF